MDGSRTRDLLTSVLPDELIETRAEELEVVERDRKVDIVALVWTLMLGVAGGGRADAGLASPRLHVGGRPLSRPVELR